MYLVVSNDGEQTYYEECGSLNDAKMKAERSAEINGREVRVYLWTHSVRPEKVYKWVEEARGLTGNGC